MAEALVFLVLQKIATSVGGQVLNTINAELAKEASLLIEVESSMKQIENEFAVMQAFISQVDTHNSRNKTLVAWLEQVRKVAFEVEDIIDEYTYLIGKYLASRGHVGGFKNFLRKTFRHSKNIAAWHNIASQVKKVETRLEKLTIMKGRYGITVNETGGSSVSDFVLRRRQMLDSPYLNHEDEIVGNEEETQKLIEWLTNGKEARVIISIFGMGGLGKTTLARSIYKNPIIKRYFQRSIWIPVSQSYRVEDLLRMTLTQITGQNEAIRNDTKDKDDGNNINSMGLTELAEKAQSYLREKRYLIVLDDVWSRDAWSSLDPIVVKNNLGSRVIITTRIEDVASLADENHDLKLGTLQEEKAWDLFCKRAFSKLNENCCPQHLEHWAKKIVDKCQGLPLAIVSIGSLLSYREQEEQEWQSFYNQLNWQLTNNPELNWVVASVLNLSFNDLPSYLRNCFLYCGLFPEDYLIKRKWLIRLWIAEGFVEERGPETTMEEVAGSYVKELVHRSMLQVVERNNFGREKTLQIHDLVREITLTTARKEKFGIVCNSPGITISDEQARRVSVHEGGSTLQPNMDLRQLRSFVLFENQLPSSTIKNVSSNFKLLRVLCLRRANMERIPDAVFDLFNLHYLDLRRTNVDNIPKSLGKLQNLQTLDLSRTYVKKLPHEITKLRKLRHLFAAMPVPHDICRLKCLQTLHSIQANKLLIQNIGRLTLLRKLLITKVEATYFAELWSSLKMMPGITSLEIYVTTLDVVRLDSTVPLPSLQKLLLELRLDEGAVPSIFADYGKLRELKLWWSGLRHDPLRSFSRMPNLVYLHLYRAYEGQRLSFHAGWFPKLKCLTLDCMEQVSAIDIEDGAIESLHRLELFSLPSLTVLPEGIVHLLSLQVIFLYDMPMVFFESLGGSDRSLISVENRSVKVEEYPRWLPPPREGMQTY